MITHVKMDKRDLLRLMKHTNYANWVFLQYLAANMDGDMFQDLIHNMTDETMAKLKTKDT